MPANFNLRNSRRDDKVLKNPYNFSSIFREVDRMQTLPPARPNQSCPILRLPTEILIKILSEVLQLFDSASWDFNRLTDIATVAKPFATTLRSSCFWPVLRAEDSRKLLETVLIRNPEGPLAIEIGCESVADDLRQLYALALPHQYRWSSLLYEVDHSWDVLWPFLEKPTPSLVSLELTFPDPGGIVLGPSMGPGTALQIVRLWNVGIPWGSDRLRGLHTLDLTYHWRKTAPEPATLVDLLQGLRELRHLRLHLDYPSRRSRGPIHDRQVIRLPNLTSIVIIGHSVYGHSLVPRISSDLCRVYRHNAAYLNPSIFNLDTGTHFRHTTKTVIQTLRGLELRYIYRPNVSSLRLLGSSSLHRPSVRFQEEPWTNLDFEFKDELNQHPRSSAWKQLASFLNSALDPNAFVRLSVDVSGMVVEGTFPPPDLLGLIDELDRINSVHLQGSARILDILEWYCPTSSPPHSSHSSEVRRRCQRLRHLTLLHPMTEFGKSEILLVSQFVRSIIHCQGSHQSHIESLNEGLVVWCPKFLIDSDLLSSELPVRWLDSGWITLRTLVPDRDYGSGWKSFEAEWNHVFIAPDL